MREFGALLTRHGFLADQEDVFYLRHGRGALGARGAAALLELRRRRGSREARSTGRRSSSAGRRSTRQCASGLHRRPSARHPRRSPTRSRSCTGGSRRSASRSGSTRSDADEGVLTGIAASPGVAEGVARVILRPDQLGELEDGEILVAPFTSPSWTPVFGKIAAAVSTRAGSCATRRSSPANTACPPCVGTGTATKRIRTGDRLHVDANTGVVTIL